MERGVKYDEGVGSPTRARVEPVNFAPRNVVTPASYFIAHCKLHCERKLTAALQQLGYFAYSPLLHLRPDRPHKSARTVQFLPGLVLVRDDGNGLPPGATICCDGSFPLRVPAVVVGAMRARERDGVIHYDSAVQRLSGTTALDQLFKPMRGYVRSELFPRLVQHVNNLLTQRAA